MNRPSVADVLRFVGLTVTVVIVALAEAGCWVTVHEGFGMGDLFALALWSLPLGGVTASAGFVLRSAARPKGALRVFVAIALGALMGVLWTLLMAHMMEPWFGTFSFPVLPILVTSSALASGFFAMDLTKTRSAGST